MRKGPLHLRHAIVRLHGGGGNREAGRMRGPRRCTRHRARAGSAGVALLAVRHGMRSEEHTSELQSLMRISYAVVCLKQKTAHPVTPPVTSHITRLHVINIQTQ